MFRQCGGREEKNMRYTLNGSYGQVMGQMPFTGGKVFVVGDASGNRKEMLQEIFKMDPDGVDRFFTTIAAAESATVADRGDIIFVLPGHSEDISLPTKSGVTIVNLGNGSYLGTNPNFSEYSLTTKTVTPGDVGATTLFTVTGEVEAIVVGYIDTTVTSSGGTLKLEVGVTGATASLIAQAAEADLIAGDAWVDATPATVVSKPSAKVIANGANIIQTVSGEAAIAGQVTYYCYWRPLSANGKVVAA